ncbi:MAG: radical SAM protein, partial [Candidatus Thorarchaeota archaeon]
IVHWLQEAVKRSGFERAWLLSPNALCYGGRGAKPNPDKLESLLRRATSVEGLDQLYFGSFPSEVRPEFVTRSLLKIFRNYVANDSIQIGIQSGSNEVLQAAKRHHTVEEGVEAVVCALECGFVPHVDMIFGLPGESVKNLGKSIELCYNLADMGAKIHGHVFMPLPGSEFEHEPAGRLPDHVRSRLGDLSRRGLMTGSWYNQELLGKELEDY